MIMDLYRENLLDHYRNPRNFGKPGWKGNPPVGGQVILAEELNPSCGDRIGVALKTEKEAVTEIKFWGEGCVVSIAAMSMLTERIKSIRSIRSIKSITSEDVLKLLGGKEMVPPARLKCALLGWEAVRKALRHDK
jgi:nitrogen fixation NifU-like protein